MILKEIRPAEHELIYEYNALLTPLFITGVSNTENDASVKFFTLSSSLLCCVSNVYLKKFEGLVELIYGRLLPYCQ